MTEAEWLACTDPQLMRESLEGDLSERKLRLFASACVRRAWHLLSSHQSREAMEVVERYAHSQAPLRELEQARKRAWGVSAEFDRASDEMEGTPDGRFKAESLAAGAVANACGFDDKHPYFVRVTSTAYEVGEAAWHAAVGIGRPADAPVTRETEWLAQAGLLRDIFGNRPRKIKLKRQWLTPTVVSIAQAIYAERAFDRLPILADGLEDAGCTNRNILDHCRSEGPHVRGCWVVDLLTGRQ